LTVAVIAFGGSLGEILNSNDDELFPSALSVNTTFFGPIGIDGRQGAFIFIEGDLPRASEIGDDVVFLRGGNAFVSVKSVRISIVKRDFKI
jgi:hypothetical protein